MDHPDPENVPLEAAGKPSRRSPLRWMVFLGILAFVLLVFMMMARFGRLRQAQKAHETRVDSILAEMHPARPTASAAPVGEVERLKNRIRALEEENRRLRSEQGKTPAAAPLPSEPPGAGAPPLEPSSSAQARFTEGLRELRQGRIAEAESQFFRALPRSAPYLLLTSLIRGDYREALSFMSRAAEQDPLWYRKVPPRSAFGSEEAYLKVLAALEARVRENPLDGEAKTLLAFLYYHEKGANFAKVLLVEATSAAPDLKAAGSFLESLDK